jgi:hypothetical protein
MKFKIGLANNKRGFLLAEETLKIIIAVIAIGFLAYFLISLYFSIKTSQELEQAKTTLPFIMSEIKAEKTSIDIYNPKDWFLGSWPHIIEKNFLFIPTGSESEFPDACANIGLTKCLCLCPKDNKDSCDNKGICADNEGFLIEGSSIKIENPPISLNVDLANKIISKK